MVNEMVPYPPPCRVLAPEGLLFVVVREHEKKNFLAKATNEFPLPESSAGLLPRRAGLLETG